MATPASTPASQPYQPKREKPGGLAITSLVLGIIGVFLSWIPFINYIAVILGVIGLVLGGIGIFRSKRVLSIVGVVLSLAAIVISFVAFNDFVNNVNEELNSSALYLTD